MNNWKYYYSVEPIMKKVTKQEYANFINNYPRSLVRDVTGICEPPYVSYNDFELADRWPYSIVASASLYDEKGYFDYPEEDRDYRIMSNYEEVFKSRTGNKTLD